MGVVGIIRVIRIFGHIDDGIVRLLFLPRCIQRNVCVQHRTRGKSCPIFKNVPALGWRIRADFGVYIGVNHGSE